MYRTRLRAMDSNSPMARPERWMTRIPAMRLPGVRPFQNASNSVKYPQLRRKKMKDAGGHCPLREIFEKAPIPGKTKEKNRASTANPASQIR